MSNWSSGICQKHPQIRFSAFLWQRLVWFQFWGWFRKFKKINWSSRPTLSLHCRFSCAVSHLSGTIHTVDQMCPDLFTLWGWNVHFRHFNREQEEYRTREKKSYKNFSTKGKLKRLRQRWGSIFAYAPLCSLCQCTIVTSYFRYFVREDFQTWEGITTRQSCVLENKFEAKMRAVSLLLLHCVLSASAQDQDGCEFLHIIIWNWMTHKLVAITSSKYSNI